MQICSGSKANDIFYLCPETVDHQVLLVQHLHCLEQEAVALVPERVLSHPLTMSDPSYPSLEEQHNLLAKLPILMGLFYYK